MRWLRRAGILVAALVAGCATTGTELKADSPAALKEKVVAERADARWQALMKRDYEGAYKFFSRASRDATPLEKFQAKTEAVEYRAVAIDKVECNGEVCTVKLKLTYDFPPARTRGVVTPVDEDWIIEQGTAWFVFRG